MSNADTAACSVDMAGEHCQVSGVLDFTTAGDALQSLSVLLPGREQLLVDLGGLTRCNSAALSVMLEIRGQALRQGTELNFANVPDGLVQLAKVCQVDVYI